MGEEIEVRRFKIIIKKGLVIVIVGYVRIKFVWF